MGVDALILVQVGRVAVRAGNLILGRIHRDRNHLAANVVIDSLVAVGALEVEAAHMDVLVFLGEVETLIQVAVLDAVAAAAVEVTFAAVFTRGAAHALRSGDEVYFLNRVAIVALGIEVCIGMASQAVDVLCCSEIIGKVFPAIARMTGRACFLIARGADAEVVESG